MDKKLFDQHISDLCEQKFRNKKLTYFDDQDRVCLKQLPKKCEDCEYIVANREVVYFLRYIGTNMQHWRKKCLNCKQVWDKK